MQAMVKKHRTRCSLASLARKNLVRRDNTNPTREQNAQARNV